MSNITEWHLSEREAIKLLFTWHFSLTSRADGSFCCKFSNRLSSEGWVEKSSIPGDPSLLFINSIFFQIRHSRMSKQAYKYRLLWGRTQKRRKDGTSLRSVKSTKALSAPFPFSHCKRKSWASSRMFIVYSWVSPGKLQNQNYRMILMRSPEAVN